VAEVSIYDEISPWGVTAQDFAREIGSISAPVVNLHLNTPGGDVFDGFAIYNAIKGHPSTFNAFIPGICASIGTVIAMAADRIVIAPHARMMIHEAHAMTAGDAGSMAKMAERLEATSQSIAETYAERAGGSADDWRERMKAETWYTDQQAVTAGLADEVGRSGDVRAIKQAALFDLSHFQHGNRIAASLALEVAETPEHACICGADTCPLTAVKEPEPIPVMSERARVEAAIAEAITRRSA
jgi:ATP-dependent protease ClpP protease subunit